MSMKELKIGETLKCLLGTDEDFSNKFTQLLSKVKIEVSERVW